MRDINAILTSSFKQRTFERFERLVDRREPKECWPWRGLRTVKGYGILNVWLGRNCGNEGAHRLAWLFANGPLPIIEGHGVAHILHRCDNPTCVNPEHLFPGTYRDNNRDKSAKGRAPRGVTHPHTTLTEEQVRALKSDPRKALDIAVDYGISEGTVNRIKNGGSWAHVKGDSVRTERTAHFRGEKHFFARLTEDIVRSIRIDPRPCSVIARKLNVNPSTIDRVKRRKTWAFVT